MESADAKAKAAEISRLADTSQMPSSVAMGADRVVSHQSLSDLLRKGRLKAARNVDGRQFPVGAFVICCHFGTSLRQFGILVIRSQRDSTKRTCASRAIEILYGAPSFDRLI